MQFLSEIFDAAKSLNGETFFIDKSATHVSIQNNLNNKYEIRNYQHEAIGRLIYYLDEYPNSTKPVHLLFNMATGSGKTIVMAAAILKLYENGYRNFIFTTRLSSVIHKTLDNLLNRTSSKYLFDNSLNMDSKSIEIRKVVNFSGKPESNVIQIMFTTTGALHAAIKNPRENSISLSELEENPIVILADEAHNLSAETLSKKDADEEYANWESTVKSLHSLNSSNVLLEFTATARLEDLDSKILAKYQNVLLYKFTLKEMRQAGFSKNVETLQLDAPLYQRVLNALVLSLYREIFSANHGILLKTVVLFKANRLNIKDQIIDRSTVNPTYVGSQNFLDFYNEMFESLSEADIDDLNVSSHGELRNALEYLLETLGSSGLVNQLKESYFQTSVLSVDSSSEKRDKHLFLNSLEDYSNPIRVVIATESLNEGWDVQNLYDIVRLYDSRDAKGNKAGKNTIQEAQLIGRGARYFPFESPDEGKSDKRRYDDSISPGFHWMEKLAYHSMRNPRYIQELEQVLVEQGVIASGNLQRDITTKNEVLASEPWKSMEIYSNTLVPKTKDSAQHRESALPDRCRSVSIDLPTFEQIAHSVFDDAESIDYKSNTKTIDLNPAVIDPQIWLAALDKLPDGTYERLSAFLPFLKSRKDFISGENYLQSVSIQISGISSKLDELNPDLQFEIALNVCNSVIDRLTKIETVGFGDFLFSPRKFTDVFGKQKLLNFDEQNPRATGDKSFDFLGWDWFAQNEIWGTSEEYSFVKFFESNIEFVYQYWQNVLLVRNESHISIYDFDSGQRFNPDFIILLHRLGLHGDEFVQIFVEPKGNQFLDSSRQFAGGAEGWKQSLLESIGSRAQVSQNVISKIEVLGLPFYNAGQVNFDLHQAFVEKFKTAITKK